MIDRWANWWFLNGGGIHRAWKYKNYSDIRDLANALPKFAWDEQQKEIDRLNAELKLARDVIDSYREVRVIILPRLLHGDQTHRAWLNDEISTLLDRVDNKLAAYDAPRRGGKEGGDDALRSRRRHELSKL